MNLLRTSEFRVGLLVTVVLTLLAVMIVQVSEDPSYYGRTKAHWFRIKDASGLVKNSSVRMAGISVGIIRSISLVDGQARIDLTVRREVPITTASTIEIKANGILGDKYIEISSVDTTAAALEDGAEIANVKSSGSMEDVMNQVSKVTDSLEDVAVALKSATTGQGDRNTVIGRILLNVETLTADLSDFASGKKEKLNAIVDNLHSTTETLDEMVNDETDAGFRAAWTAAVQSLNRIDRSLANIEEITDKVNSGKGTLGKLVNDDETIEEVNKAVAGVNQMLGVASKIQTNLDIHSEYLANQDLYKTYLGVRIQPGLDRYYEIAVVDDPKGVVETTQTQTSSNPGGPTSSDPTVTERKTFKNRVKFTALFAKNFYDFTIKGGLIESTGGLGMDYSFWRKKLRFSFEVFDVTEDNVRLRSSLRYNFMRGLYVIGGADDIASRQGNFTSYLGAGLDLTNDDLKAFLGKISF